jgi:hypothetical protein
MEAIAASLAAKARQRMIRGMEDGIADGAYFHSLEMVVEVLFPEQNLKRSRGRRENIVSNLWG